MLWFLICDCCRSQELAEIVSIESTNFQGSYALEQLFEILIGDTLFINVSHLQFPIRWQELLLLLWS